MGGNQWPEWPPKWEDIMAMSFLQTVLFFGADQAKATGVHVFAHDADIDTAISVVSSYASYAQLAAEDTVDVISSGADTTQQATIIGVDETGRRAIEVLDIVANPAFTTGTSVWRYIENFYLNMECAGTITLRRTTGPATINIIPIGQVAADVVQHFSGDDNMCWLLGWWAGTTWDQDQGAFFELRWYPSDSDSLDSADGYRLLDRIDVDTDADATGPGEVRVTFPSPIQLPIGGWIVVFADSEGDNKAGYAGMQVIDVATVGVLPAPAKITTA